MHSVVNCRYCGKYIATCHGYEVGSKLRKHYREKHEKEFEEMTVIATELKKLRIKYGYYGTI